MTEPTKNLNFPRDTDGHRLVKNVRPDLRLQHPWPDDCFVQGGASGIVFSGKGNYTTAFFEAFPCNPDTFLRGEGTTVELAEDDAWAQHQRQLFCPSQTGDHEYETRGYKNGAGFCKHCDLFSSKIFNLTDIGSVCFICGTDYYDEVGDRLVCEKHCPPSYSEIEGSSRDVEEGHDWQPPVWIAPLLVDDIPWQDMDFNHKYATHRAGRELFLDWLLEADDMDSKLVELRGQENVTHQRTLRRG